MQVNEFIQLREQDWKRLEQFVNRHRGRAPLSAREVHELGKLYRAVTSDLALARRDYPNQSVTRFLNQLLTRTHSYIYQQDVSDFGKLARYFTHQIPNVFRQSAIYALIALVLFLVPALIAFRILSVNPQSAATFGLEEQRRMLSAQESWTNIPVEQRPYASTFIMGNNIRISILAFAGGLAFGLFTIYVLAINGVILGGVLGLAAHYGMADTLVAFIIGHGVIELSIIFISGGAGLALGWALLNPGRYSRRDSLTDASRRFVPLAVAAIPFLIVAALIEGFVSPSDLPFVSRAAVGVCTGAVMYSYLLFAGR
jgi:uncharacterized membrane protein SpoIIM required for sporulation